jgi:formylglycine-generating enzyme required for sulfatase activity
MKLRNVLCLLVMAVITLAACDDGGGGSGNGNGNGNGTGTVAKPTANPAAGTVASGASVTLASATAGADIYYTTDGSTPTTGSAKYATPFAITPPVTVKAIAVKDGMANSGILTAAYTLASGGNTVATPTADPAAGAVASGASVTLASATAGADIYYTTDGSTPTTSSAKYATPFAITPPVTVKAIAVKNGMANSGILTAAYTLASGGGTVAMPTADPAAGAVASGASVTLASATAGADIYYTTDGSTPTTGSAKYAAPFAITPPVTVKAIAVKNGMANSGILTAAYTYTLRVAMVAIYGDYFMMGSPPNEPGRDSWTEQQHGVMLSDFYMGVYQVTQEEYQAVMGSNPSAFTTAVSGESGTPGKLPVEMVRWYDALVFCNKLSIAEGLSPAYRIDGSTDPTAWGTVPESNNATWNAVEIADGANGYRLPTEAQWEYACRAGRTTAYNTGSAISDNTGWYLDNSGSKTHQVGLKPPNAWGLYDMHGNVYEWCWDWYENSYQIGWDWVLTDPSGPVSGNERVWRGGYFDDSAQYVRSARRSRSYPQYQYNYVGFRLVRP